MSELTDYLKYTLAELSDDPFTDGVGYLDLDFSDWEPPHEAPDCMGSMGCPGCHWIDLQPRLKAHDAQVAAKALLRAADLHRRASIKAGIEDPTGMSRWLNILANQYAAGEGA